MFFQKALKNPHLDPFFISEFQLSGDGDRSQELMRSFILDAYFDPAHINRIAAFASRLAGYPIPRTKILQDVKQKSLCSLRGLKNQSLIFSSAVMLGLSEQFQDFVGTGDLMIRITDRGEEIPGTEVIVVGVLFEDVLFGKPLRGGTIPSSYSLLTLPLYSDMYSVDKAAPSVTIDTDMKDAFNLQMDADSRFAANYPKYIDALTITKFRGEWVRWEGGGGGVS